MSASPAACYAIPNRSLSQLADAGREYALALLDVTSTRDATAEAEVTEKVRRAHELLSVVPRYKEIVCFAISLLVNSFEDATTGAHVGVAQVTRLAAAHAAKRRFEGVLRSLQERSLWPWVLALGATVGLVVVVSVKRRR